MSFFVLFQTHDIYIDIFLFFEKIILLLLGNTPLHWCVYRNTFETVKYLIDNGANVNAVNVKEGASVLHWAAIAGDVKVLVCLLKHGADIHGIDKRGYNCLIHAVKKKAKYCLCCCCFKMIVFKLFFKNYNL
jgi:hypothetical protein